MTIEIAYILIGARKGNFPIAAGDKPVASGQDRKVREGKADDQSRQ
jgi:hypothetical protein